MSLEKEIRMQAVVVEEFCETLTQVKVSNTPQPRPKPNELLIKVYAAGVNFVDTLYVGPRISLIAIEHSCVQGTDTALKARGKHQNNRALVRPPFTLGIEFAGIVLNAPPASPFKEGDAVFGDYTGSYAEYICLPVDSPTLRKTPSRWTHVDAAGLAATLPVSYDSLVRRAQLKESETVLIHAAAGGLGIMAVQVAVALGCRVIGTAGSEEKCKYAESFGAEICFDYTKKDWYKKVIESTDGRGVDVVYDPVGLVDPSLKCVADRGRVLVVGFAGREGDIEKIAMNRVLLKQAQLIGYASLISFLQIYSANHIIAVRRDSSPTSKGERAHMGRT
jgi:NADPH:quinone reductase